MNTTLLTKKVSGERPKPSTKRPAPKQSRNTRRYIAIVAALAILAAAVWAAASFGDDDAADVVAAPALVLSLGDDSAMASCLAMDTTILAGMSPAFAATATAVEGEKVTLTVDRWYAGGDATTVELNAQPGQAALIAGFDFEVGEQYLITAAEGNVNFCGYSGPATPELTNLFNQAFPG